MKRGKIWAMAVAAVLAGTAGAQNLAGAFDSTATPQEKKLVGKPAVDLLPGKKTGLAYPLRYPNVVPGTVKVWLMGKELRENEDFRLDYGAGLLYLLVPVRPSDSIRVLYRHDPTAKESASGASMLPIFTLNFGQMGSMKMLLGATGVNRMADGTLMQSHTGGIQNNFKFAGSSLEGVFLVSSQAAPTVEADSASPDMRQPKKGTEGTDSLVMQSLKTDVGNGFSLSADFQDVGEKFEGFGMLGGSGMKQDEINQLQKEKGITRYGFGLNGKSGQLSLANSFRTIDDGKGRITWQNYGVEVGGLAFHYNSRSVDGTFSRFNDIAEQDRAQLQKERGIDRLDFGGSLAFAPNAKFSFNQKEITADGDGFYRRDLGLDTSFLKVQYSRQEISQGFGRAKDLAEGERNQWLAERGFRREALSFALPKNEKASLLTFSQNRVQYGDSADFLSRAVGLDFGNVRAQYWTRETSREFSRLENLTPDEKNQYVAQTLAMYDGAKAHQDDPRWFARENGLKRSFFRFDAGLGGKSAFSFRNVGIEGQIDAIQYQQMNLDLRGWSLEYRNLHFGQGFDRAFDLLDAERKFYGNQQGFSRQDLALNGTLGKSKLALSWLDVEDGDANLSRFKAAYEVPGLKLSGGIRSVSDDFTRARDVNDGEKDFLAQLIGYNQVDLQYEIGLIPRLRLSGQLYDSDNGDERLKRSRNEHQISWQIDKNTELQYRVSGHHFQGFSGDLFVNQLNALSAKRNFGKWGTLSVVNESETFRGSDNQRPDRKTQGLRYENQITKSLKLSTEQFRTDYSDGGYENVSAYGAAWQITPRLGISLKDVHVDRDEAKNTQRFLDYGVSYDFGKGVKIGYTFHRELNSQGGGKRNYRYEMSEGEFGGFKAGGSYDEKRIDNQRTTALGGFHISNTKPFDLGILKDVRMSFGYDSHTDQSLWKKETKLASFGASLFGTRVEMSYDQLMLPSQERAYDRTYKWIYDPSGKKPLQASLVYKSRALPGGDSIIVRDYDVSYKLNDRLKLNLTTETFPEKEKKDAPFGSILQPTRSRTYGVDWKINDASALTVAYSEIMDLAKRNLVRRSTGELTLFADTGSPLRLTYGMDQSDRNGNRQTRFLYQLSFDQKPGPNQTLSFLIGNIDWDDGKPNNELWNRWDIRIDYQLRF